MQNKQEKGFTLIEVMISLVIATISIVALLKSSSQTAINIIYFQNKTLANIVASNLAIEARLVKQKVGYKNKKYQMAGRDWPYQFHTSKSFNKLLNTNITKTEVLVYNNKQDKASKSHSAKIIVQSYQNTQKKKLVNKTEKSVNKGKTPIDKNEKK